MTIKLINVRSENNGGNGLSVKGENIQLEVSGGAFNNNGKSGVRLRVGTESDVSLDKIELKENLEDGLIIEEYNRNFDLIEQFINSNLKKVTQEESNKLTELIEQAKNTEQIDVKKSFVSEIYDILKNGLIISSMSVGVEKAFEAIIGIAG
jgi:hypothetical protein